MPGFGTEYANRLLDYAFRGVEPPSTADRAGSLHAVDPGVSGGGELNGLGYAREAVTFNPAENGVIVLGANTTFSNLPGAWILYIGMWTTDSPAVYVGSMPNGQLREFTATAADDTFTVASHGLVDGMPVCLLPVTGASLPAPLLPDEPYYIRDATANTFRLTAAAGGPILALSSDGGGTVRRVHRMDPGENFTLLAGSQFAFLGI